MATTPPGTSLQASPQDENDPGTAVVSSNIPANPGLAPEHQRVTDLDPKEEKKAA